MGVYDISTYPDSIDGYSQIRIVRDGIDEIIARDHNSLRSAVINIEQELGLNPSGSYSTIRARLDVIGDASSAIDAHLIDTVGAHAASAISISDTADKYVASNVEDALSELAAILPSTPNVLGKPSTTIPNSGVPNFVNGLGSLFLYNSLGADILKKTQPSAIKGVHVVEVGTANGTGTGAQLKLESPGVLSWKAPGDSFGTAVNITSLSEGDVVLVSSSTSSKKIRVARNSDALVFDTDTFEIIRLDAQSGAFSETGTGIVESNFITRTASSSTGTSINQFVIGGVFYPADRGTLVLQRKLRGGTSFEPIAVLDLGDNFDEDERTNGQPVYIPTYDLYDTITLFDRLPARMDYETLSLDSNGSVVYDNFDINETFNSFQMAKYAIPVSNTDILEGELEELTGVSSTLTEAEVSAYRVVHYIPGETDFSGDPSASKVYSIVDSIGSAVSDGDNNVRMSNVVVDSNAGRPGFEAVVLRPIADVPSIAKKISGISYYNSENDEFDLEIKTDDNVFKNTYKKTGIIGIESDTFNIQLGDAYGGSIDVTDLLDDGYALYSDSNVPSFLSTSKDHGFFLVNSSYNTDKRLTPAVDKFSANAFITTSINDPFGVGSVQDAYGLITSSVKLQVNSYYPYTATDSEEFFVDESYRNGTLEDYSNVLDYRQFNHNYGPSLGGYTLVPWDETIPLVAGELQVGGLTGRNVNTAGLIWPQENYLASGIRPTQQSSTNYSSGFSGTDSIYQRLFSLNYPISSGKLRIKSDGDYKLSFNDISASNASRPIKIELKIPGSSGNYTGFLDLGKAAQAGQYDDADGCMSWVEDGVGDFTVNFNFMQRSNADSGGMIAVRITYLTAQYSNAKERIITYVGLSAID